MSRFDSLEGDLAFQGTFPFSQGQRERAREAALTLIRCLESFNVARVGVGGPRHH